MNNRELLLKFKGNNIKEHENDLPEEILEKHNEVFNEILMRMDNETKETFLSKFVGLSVQIIIVLISLGSIIFLINWIIGMI